MNFNTIALISVLSAVSLVLVNASSKLRGNRNLSVNKEVLKQQLDLIEEELAEMEDEEDDLAEVEAETEYYEAEFSEIEKEEVEEDDIGQDMYDGNNYNDTVPDGYENGDSGPHGFEQNPDDDETPKAPIGGELPVTQEESSDEMNDKSNQ